MKKVAEETRTHPQEPVKLFHALRSVVCFSVVARSRAR